MTPSELEQLSIVLKNESNPNTVWIIVSVLILLTPVIIWAVRIIFRNTVKDIVEDSVKPQIELLEKTFEQNRKQADQMFSIMEMHIDELSHIKNEQKDIKMKVDNNEKNIKKNYNSIKDIFK